MKILFVEILRIPYNVLLEQSRAKKMNNTALTSRMSFPIGLLSIESYVKTDCPGVETKILSQNLELQSRLGHDADKRQKNLIDIVDHFDAFLFDDIKRTIDEIKPDVIGLSVMFDACADIFEKACEKLSAYGLPIIAGGHPLSNMYEYYLKRNPALTAVSIGEGEIPFAEFVKAFENGYGMEYLQSSPYFVTAENLSDEEFKPSQTFVQNLDDIPHFDYESLFDKYGWQLLSYSAKNLNSKYNPDLKQMSLLTSRGCPYDCVFCASQKVHGHKVRERSMSYVEKELWRFAAFGVKEITLEDDHILYDVPRAIQIIDMAGALGMKVYCPNGLAIAPITQDFVDCLVRNNTAQVNLALESGSQRVLKEIIRKPVTTKRAAEVFKMFAKTKIKPMLFLIFGFPNESIDDINEGLSFLRSIPFWWGSVFSPIPISGSRLFSEQYDKLPVKDDGSYDFNKFVNYLGLLQKEELRNKFPNGNMIYTINLDINFVNNSYIRQGGVLLESVHPSEREFGVYKIRTVRDEFLRITTFTVNHAFAYYYAAKCSEMLGEPDDGNYEKALDIIRNNDEWRTYADYFNINY
jgi:radical SAM superfamily enzyme YgiQ (UPF0313 family)